MLKSIRSWARETVWPTTAAPVPQPLRDSETGESSPAEHASINPGANHDRISVTDVMKQIAWLGIPTALSYTFSFSIVALGVMAGRIESGDEQGDQDYIGSAALAATMANTVAVIAVSSLYAINIITSKNYGKLKKDDHGQLMISQTAESGGEVSGNDDSGADEEVRADISRILKNSSFISLGISPFAFFPLYFSKDVLMALGQSENVATLAQSFLRPYSFAIPGLLLRLSEEQIMLSFKKQIPAMVMGLANFAAGVFLADMLCFGRFSAPQLNLAGVAYGFTTEAYLTMISFGLYLAKAGAFKNFNFFKPSSFTRKDWAQVKELLSKGWPITLTLTMEISSMFAISMFAGKLGSDALTAYSFWAQFYFFILIPLFALGQVTQQEVGRTIGAEKYFNISRVAKYGLLTSGLIISPLCIVVSAYPELLKLIITDQNISDEVMQIVKALIPIASAGIVFDTARYNMLQVLRQTGDHLIPTGISVTNTWLGVLLAYVLGFHTELGILGVGIGYNAGLATGALGLLPRWLKALKSYDEKSTTGSDDASLQTVDETTPLQQPNPPHQDRKFLCLEW